MERDRDEKLRDNIFAIRENLRKVFDFVKQMDDPDGYKDVIVRLNICFTSLLNIEAIGNEDDEVVQLRSKIAKLMRTNGALQSVAEHKQNEIKENRKEFERVKAVAEKYHSYYLLAYQMKHGE